jgi:soluble P-type ATPase
MITYIMSYDRLIGRQHMSVAVVFDSAGTLLHTYRVAKDVVHDVILEDVETIPLTFCDMERSLVTLYAHSRQIMDLPSDMLLSSFLVENRIRFSVACSCQVVTTERLEELLYQDRHAYVGDLQECIRMVWDSCKKETVVAMASGAILNQNMEGIEFTITSGGKPFPRAKETITDLHRKGIATYIASGDRTDKLVRMAQYLGVPQCNVHGVATPTIKAQIVEDLKRLYDVVVMVGDGINDLNAMKAADISILTEQQSDRKPDALREAADYRIKCVWDVVDIVAAYSNAERVVQNIKSNNVSIRE